MAVDRALPCTGVPSVNDSRAGAPVFRVEGQHLLAIVAM